MLYLSEVVRFQLLTTVYVTNPLCSPLWFYFSKFSENILVATICLELQVKISNKSLIFIKWFIV